MHVVYISNASFLSSLFLLKTVRLWKWLVIIVSSSPEFELWAMLCALGVSGHPECLELCVQVNKNSSEVNIVSILTFLDKLLH